MKEAADGPAEGHPRLQRRAAGVGRLQPRPGIVDLRRDADQGHRGTLVKVCALVRQRVGLLQPHARHHGRAVVARALMKVLRMTDVDLRGKRVLIREDLNVPVEDGEVTERRAHPRVAADHPLRARSGREGVHHVAPRPARRRASSTRRCRSRRSRRGSSELLGQAGAAARRTGSTASTARPGSGGAAARTCASTRARRRTTKSSRGRWRRCATSS